MSDQNVREIQLGGKQLVFLFMTAVVLAIAIFLLGISVGRGVGSAPGETAAAATDVAVTDPIAPADMPPATETTPADLAYHDQLQGQAPPPAAEPAPSTAERVTPPTIEPSPAPAPAPPPVASTAKPSATKPPAAPASGTGWFVQVNAFKSRQNADRQAADLRAKGYAAIVQSDPGSLFRVRIGPFADRAEADRTMQRVRREEGIPASVQQR